MPRPPSLAVDHYEKLRQEVQKGIEDADGDDLVDHDTVFARLKAMAAGPPSGNN